MGVKGPAGRGHLYTDESIGVCGTSRDTGTGTGWVQVRVQGREGLKKGSSDYTGRRQMVRWP